MFKTAKSTALPRETFTVLELFRSEFKKKVLFSNTFLILLSTIHTGVNYHFLQPEALRFWCEKQFTVFKSEQAKPSRGTKM